MARQNPNIQSSTRGVSSRGSGGRGTTILTEDQEQAIAELKAEREIYKEQLKRARRKRSKIKDILDNFEAVVIGDVLLDVLPDENADEIVNSVIISKTDIINVLNGFDTTEITEEVTTTEFVPYTGTFGTGQNVTTTTTVGTGVTVSGYTEGQIDSAIGTLDRIFNSSTIRELISLSPILNDGELYSPIYFQRINEVDGGPNGKELLEEIIKDIETTTKEPNISPAP